MADADIGLFTIKLATLEYLVKTLYVIKFSEARDPVSAIQGYAEYLRLRMERAAETVEHHGVAVHIEEHLNVFFEEVAEELRKNRDAQPP